MLFMAPDGIPLRAGAIGPAKHAQTLSTDTQGDMGIERVLPWNAARPRNVAK